MNSDRWNEVVLKQLFQISVAVFQIERIQNPSLYSQYQLCKRSVERNMFSLQPTERELIYGTDQSGIKNTLQNDFDCNFAGKNGELLFKHS